MTSSTNSSFDSLSLSDTEGNGCSSGVVGLSDENLTQGRRQMLDLVNRLHSTGVQVDIDLPQIAVIGSQSAGKSSLIESISGITLPRAAGTCTRCPTECQLSHSNTPWKCEVSLRFITDGKGQLLGQARKTSFGGVIYNKSEVEERIRRAQLAILNPNKPAKQFLEGDDAELHFDDSLSFSSNFVSLKISGIGIADLSFVDLPGLIASVSSGRGHSNDIALVESLVTSYIKKPSCLILLTVACETDFENQGAHRLAKQHDPLGKRTIGVLTKPDRIPTGEESNWLPFIRNEKESLENNWYCVKQPSSSDLKNNITWEGARRREDEFFSMTSPWCELEAYYQKYMRTSNLVDRLSSILSDLIAKRLPKLHEELHASISKVRDQINALPRAPSSNPFSEIINLLNTFAIDLRRRVVEGIPDSDGLLQCIRPEQMKFRRAIRETAPEFRPYEKQYAGQRAFVQPTFLGQEEEVDLGDQLSPPEDPIEEHSPESIIYVDQVLTRAHEARTRELPGVIPFVVQKKYMDDIVKQWHHPTIRLLKSVRTILMNHVKDAISDHFADFGQGLLEQRIWTILYQHLKDRFDATQSRLEWLLELEGRPFTLNTHYLADYKDKFTTFYKAAREREIRGTVSNQIEAYVVFKRQNHIPAKSTSSSKRVVCAETTEIEPTGVAKVLRGLTEMGLDGVRAEDIPKMLRPDQMEPAINIMADVRAYFQVCYKRFADNVPLAIDHEFVQGIERDILPLSSPLLYTKLGVSGEDGHRICQELAQESSHVADRRAELEKKLERFEAANAELLNVGT
ncbi:hypothetical protein FA15DRAFT_644882 [Coprinopsis marcescibilis]|uniref:P-loop containing nucleoside triphosphate hydrolase protein n=1 Tax=Coprinopsis marcescibilis TaxID=230819 RepID=A0A5C3KNC7_COPMA|nr:hypothetical protein FA15DRAFT_644882 [Coprinopsis marcescibilis]